ncbi:DUF3800 domain-containing protein [Bradyrhizobium sp. SZCCHNR3118]|uniref:DUF3800 domain-containing protein n=1 Tax=Bradyrhizobium sp. SZCCHNR3118 TaxID=3057468 RepID=UPI00291648C4|nr:DUF3800 domain-containing protein [Bradyrhizobium sp. SZCCHNR3118]
MLTAYFDDSGTHGNSDVVLWSGLFGNGFQWEHFNNLWAAKLKDPSPTKDPLKRFHMAECYASDGDFLRWSRTATDFLVHELVDIIIKCGLYADAAAISRNDWDDLVKGDLRVTLGDAEGYSLRMAFVRASKWARKMGETELAFVFDRRQEREREGKRIYQLFDSFSKIEPTAVKPVSFVFSDSYNTLPLQAADLVAWHQYQYAVEYLKAGGKLKGPSSRQLQRLSKGGRVKQGFASRSAIERMVALEIGNEQRIAQAAELITATPEEFERKFNAPLPASQKHSLES